MTNDKQAAKAHAESMGLVFIDLATYEIDASVAALLPEYIARRHKVIPLRKNGSGIIMAFVNPNDPLALQDIRLSSGAQQIVLARANPNDQLAIQDVKLPNGVQQLVMVLATEDDIIDAIDRLYK